MGSRERRAAHKRHRQGVREGRRHQKRWFKRRESEEPAPFGAVLLTASCGGGAVAAAAPAIVVPGQRPRPTYTGKPDFSTLTFRLGLTSTSALLLLLSALLFWGVTGLGWHGTGQIHPQAWPAWLSGLHRAVSGAVVICMFCFLVSRPRCQCADAQIFTSSLMLALVGGGLLTATYLVNHFWPGGFRAEPLLTLLGWWKFLWWCQVVPGVIGIFLVANAE